MQKNTSSINKERAWPSKVESRGVGAKLKVARQSFMASSWQVLWTELEISVLFESNSVVKAAYARRSAGMPLPGKFEF